MSVDEKFLQMVQRRGWEIVDVRSDHCTVRCRANGCGLKAKLVPGATIPPVDPGSSRNVSDVVLRNYDDWMRGVLDRRQQLLLRISEVEQACGLTDDHLAKILKPDSKKIPNVQTAIDICNTLGFDLVLRPKEIPLVTLRRVVETRDKAIARDRRNDQDNQRRAKKESPGE